MNKAWLEGVVRTHQAEIYRYLRYLGADAVTAEDLTQEVFIVALKGSVLVDCGRAQEAAWLRGVARRLFLNHCKKQGRNPLPVDLKEAEQFWARRFSRDDGGDAYLEALKKCLEKLSSREREVVEMFYAGRLGRAQVGTQFGLSQEGVKSLLRRIRKRLADCVRSSIKGMP